MTGQKIHIIGKDDIVILLGLLGIEGTVVNDDNEFLNQFELLTNNNSVGMIIVALNLSPEILDYIIDFKLNNRKPFVYYLQDIFQSDSDMIFNRIKESIGKIIR